MASLDSIMPPRTDCSAGMSWGGFRLESDPRVVSTGSSCAIDKAAVLHLYRDLDCPVVTVLFEAHPESPCPATCPVLAAGSDNAAATLKADDPGVIPTVHRFSTEASPEDNRWPPPWGFTPSHRSRFLSSQQVLRYASPPGPGRKAGSPGWLWITCAPLGIACAQPV